MADLSRLKDPEIENGNIVNADDLDAEFDQLVSGHNDHESRIDDLESNDMTVGGLKTFSTCPVLPASNPTTSNQATRMQFILDYGPYQMQGLKVAYASASTITVAAGACLSSNGTALLKNTATKTINITASGALGLDTGAEANSTWYYVYLIGKTDGTVSALVSVTNESVSGTITQPTGYTLKRQLPIAIRNDGSGNFLKYVIASGWPLMPRIMYDESGEIGTTTLNVLNAVTGNQTATMTSLIPPISQYGIGHVVGTYGSAGSSLTVKPSGGSTARRVGGVNATSTILDVNIECNTSTGQAWAFVPSHSSMVYSLDVYGYVVTEI